MYKFIYYSIVYNGKKLGNSLIIQQQDTLESLSTMYRVKYYTAIKTNEKISCNAIERCKNVMLILKKQDWNFLLKAYMIMFACISL